MLGFVWRHLRIALVIRTLRGVEGRGVGGLNTYNKDFIEGSICPLPRSALPP